MAKGQNLPGIWWKDALLNLKMDLKTTFQWEKWNKAAEDMVDLSNMGSTCPMGELFEKRCPGSWTVMIQGETFDYILDYYECGLEDMNLSIFNNLPGFTSVRTRHRNIR